MQVIPEKGFVYRKDPIKSLFFVFVLVDVGEDNPVRIVDVIVDELDLNSLGFHRVEPLATGRPSYHPLGRE